MAMRREKVTAIVIGLRPLNVVRIEWCGRCRVEMRTESGTASVLRATASQGQPTQVKVNSGN